MDTNKKLTRLTFMDAEEFNKYKKFKTNKISSKLFKQIAKIDNKLKGIKVHLESYPKLNDKEAYVFVSTHGFGEDIASVFEVIDRHAVLLLGSIDQIKRNPEMQLLNLNGFIGVDVGDKKNRKEAYKKMVQTLNDNISILMYPEGAWNLTENLLVKEIYRGFYDLNCETGKKIVPVASIKEGKNIYIDFGEPMDFREMDVNSANDLLRDTLSTMKYNLIDKYGEKIKNNKYKPTRRDFCEEYIKECLTTVKWYDPDFDLEFISRKDKNKVTYEEAFAFLKDLNINPKNASLAKEKHRYEKYLEEEKSYDIISHLKVRHKKRK